MAQDFDTFPVYDQVTEKDGHFTPIWQDSMATFFQTLIGYLTQAGIILPPVTSAQRDTFLSPQNGQMIYNTTLDTAQYYQASTGSWINF